MDTNEILELLEGHRDRIVVALKALTGETNNGAARKTRTRKFSAATRRRMSLAMKKRWRERKRTA